MKKTSGKELENLVAIIQETTNKLPIAKVTKNCRLTNKNGTRREFDIIIEYDLPPGKHIIAIECKEHQRPVEAKEIEAFNSKCQRFPNIHKKVFVSSSGYQRDAIEAGNDLLESLKSKSISR